MQNSGLNALLTPPDMPAGSHDPHDILLRDVVSLQPDGLAEATHIILGCPQDIGVSRNHGRTGAAAAPAAIRQALYKLKPPMASESVVLADLGDLVTTDDLEAIHERLEAVVSALLQQGKIIISLGGGNDISLPDASSVGKTYPGFAAINVDAHLDMRKSGIRHSGTPYRDLIDSGILRPEQLYEVGIAPWANSPTYLADAQNLGVHIHTLHAVEQAGHKAFFDGLFAEIGGQPLFAGLDMDSVRASDAPGGSASCPAGLSARAVLDFADRCRRHGQTKLFEITEVNPTFDIDGRTAKLAALAVYTFIYGTKQELP
eukprot:TRINITY_DN17873_c0_g1_i1.p2 TRINITY_DN17873_c0_g1~~TRINITY_DN17873_c0_g1_i1.p2  ORF type:complete len:316 (-),score=78.74 TRINITY_DN17873_c0_g1_i1:211-1158(-)